MLALQVEFHDTGRGVRVPSMTDYFGFTMAAMNETGSVFASPRKGEKSPSTILYRPFSSWASNSEVVFIHTDIRAAHMQLIMIVHVLQSWQILTLCMHCAVVNAPSC